MRWAGFRPQLISRQSNIGDEWVIGRMDQTFFGEEV
jgi:hypothetical protein